MIKNVTKKEYDSIHHWLRYRYGSADMCESKTCSNISTNYQWALKEDMLYEKNRENFDMLCVSCHTKRDHTEETRAKMAISQSARRETPATQEFIDKCKQIHLKRNGTVVTYKGEKRFLNELAAERGVRYVTLRQRMDRGWDVEKAVDTPINSKYRKLTASNN